MRARRSVEKQIYDKGGKDKNIQDNDRPIMTYAAETRADTKRTKQKVSAMEMKVFSQIQGVTMWDRRTN